MRCLSVITLLGWYVTDPLGWSAISSRWYGGLIKSNNGSNEELYSLHRFLFFLKQYYHVYIQSSVHRTMKINSYEISHHAWANPAPIPITNITIFILWVSALLPWSTGNYIITHSDFVWADLMAVQVNWAIKWAVLHDLLTKSYIKTDKCLFSHGAVDCVYARKTSKQLKVYYR